jgi:pilus assembly protein Flp/PilA
LGFAGFLYAQRKQEVIFFKWRLMSFSHPGFSSDQNPIQRRKVTMYLPHEESQGLVEYALILVLVAIVVIAILTLLGPQIANIFSQVTSGLSST